MVHLDDLDNPETVPAVTALHNLAVTHSLPDYVHVYPTAVAVNLVVSHDTAEQWRAALAAPPFTEHPQQYSTQYKTSVMWFGIDVRLSYTDL